MKFSKKIVKWRIPILVITLLLMIPAVFGMISTKINYDMLNYLPDNIDTVIGQDELLNEFGKGAFSLIIVEDMSNDDVASLKSQIEEVDHVESVIWYNSIADLSIPMEMLPDDLYDAFNKENSTMMAVFFDSSTSAETTMQAINDIRSLCGKQCFVSGMSAMVADLKELCEQEEPIYVAIAVVLAVIAMLVFLDSWLAPILFLVSIGFMILLNLGTSFFLGEISYITKALSAILQLAVTMDYSIFLWNTYNEQKFKNNLGRDDAMAVAIKETLTSVIGSSVTTIAGFIALCFMSFTLGFDLGIVMAKGVLFGVIGSVTVLPALILIFDKPLQKTMHKPLISGTDKLADKIIKIFPVFLIIFCLLVAPAYYGYSKTNSEVYYQISESLPDNLDFQIANQKLSDEYNVGSTHMLLVNADLDTDDVRAMIDEMEDVDGVEYVLSLESVVGSRISEDILPESITSLLKGDKWELMMIGSEYSVASDEVNNQIDELNTILKNYDESGLLIGEAPCTKDMIEITDTDFQVVNLISIIAIFIIILLVEKSITLPVILIAIIELAIFINLGLPHYFGQSLPFIAPICISTIQLGATVDYAILMTTRYKSERIRGGDKKSSIKTALATSIPSIIVSGAGLFAATFGVAMYSDIDMISSMCMLMARGAIISMICVIIFLPSALMLLDKVVCKTTLGMTKLK